MFTVIMEKNILFYVMAAAGAVGIIGKLVSCMTVRRLARAAENMSKSDHRLMKLIRAKFEHACMVSDKVQNVDAFVDKYLFEYKVFGFRVHTWRELEKQMIWIGGIAAAVGFIGSYNVGGIQGNALYYSGLGIAEMVILFLLYQWGDEAHAWSVIHTYVVDYLENVCAHKIARIRRPQMQTYEEEEEAALALEKTGQAAGSGRVAAMPGTEAEIPVNGLADGRTGQSQNMEEAARQGRQGEPAVQRRAQEPKPEPLYYTHEGKKETESSVAGEALSRTESRREAARRRILEAGRVTQPQGKTGWEAASEGGKNRWEESGEIRAKAAFVQEPEKLERLERTERVAEEPDMAIQLDEARQNLEKDAEERKVMIREILEQYLA